MDRAEQIIDLVNNNPGIRYSEIMRLTGLKNGVLSHHLSKIEQSGKILIERTPRVARIYPCGMQKEQTMIIKNLRNQTAAAILLKLLCGDASFKDLVTETKKSQGTVSLCLKSLCDDGLVERIFNNGNMMFHLIDSTLVGSLVEIQRPSFIENTANNISDIFSSI
ncbi:winged helix-turn-helix transcriptional regulator [Candidatus Nitrosotenuis uzonensis]|uniref:Transcriptional regulator, ArsR family n=1 Tax=Candidatus Nitrosotenuis uzonensis TaxID=1407055 RepID=V6ATI3_9ARCH|nr:ArsR family transcriptional regulator [Candidatus Nitrosotenuis uzonensis]CDI05743.1 Transcriptional regulator, ArsR family [Candidatus Nitrosotenuis uzonensis]